MKKGERATQWINSFDPLKIDADFTTVSPGTDGLKELHHHRTMKSTNSPTAPAWVGQDGLVHRPGSITYNPAVERIMALPLSRRQRLREVRAAGLLR